MGQISNFIVIGVFLTAGVGAWVLGIQQKLESKGKAWALAVAGVFFGLCVGVRPGGVLAGGLVYGSLWWLDRKKLWRADSRSECSCHLVGLGIFLLFLTLWFYNQLLV